MPFSFFLCRIHLNFKEVCESKQSRSYDLILSYIRMFSGLHYIQPNERGEYEIAEGTSAATFRAILEYYQEHTFNISN